MLNFLELRKAEVRGTLLKGSSVKWSSAPLRSWWRKMFGVRERCDQRKDHMHPHLSRQAIVLDVETTRYGRTYAGRKVKITHVDKDPSTGGAVGYVVRLKDDGDELPFEPEEIRIVEAWD